MNALLAGGTGNVGHTTTIRRATATDVPLMIEFLRHMLADMAAVGGHPVATGSEHWTNAGAEFLDQLQAPGCLHLLAETSGTQSSAVGWAFARSTERELVFEPAHVLWTSHHRRFPCW